MPIYFKDLTGIRFGKLLVLKRIENKRFKNGRDQVQWLCTCDCDINKEVKITTDQFRVGKTHCGCVKKIVKYNPWKKHGLYNTRIYTIWTAMKDRCYYAKHPNYKRYGGRGITICSEWLNKDNGIINFYNWAVNNGYDDQLSIDRIDGDGNYEPNNCRWATHKEQQNNTSNNVYITYKGITKHIAEWCDEYNISRKTITWRIEHKWPEERWFEPARPLRRSNIQSGIKSIIWMKKSKMWHVKGFKDNKPDIYIKSFKLLEEAIEFKKNYDIEHPYKKV